MPVELSIVETVTELETTVTEVILDSSSAPGIPGPGVPTGGTVNQVLTKDSGSDYDTSWQDAQGAGGGAPADADYLVGTANGSLSAEIVVGTSPGGELGGTWASPTVDATHSGSSHAAVQAAAEATAAAALSSHETDQTNVHGIADTTALALTANHPTNATFNDHSARHENGGADEISLAGLDGTSTALQAHLDDTADAHDASAISVSSATLSGTGTDVQAVFEEIDNLLDDHSSRHENGGADEISIAGLDGTPTELTNHLNDISDAHDASAISFSPTGSIAATDVQAAIEEVASESGGGTPEKVEKAITQTTHGLAVGDVVRHNGTNYVKAQADSAANSEVVGIVSAVAGVDDFTLHVAGRISGLSGLTAGTVYFLSPSSAGALTATEPSTVGQATKPILVADTTTSGYFFNFRGALIASPLAADDIAVTDSGGYFADADVEAVLQSLGLTRTDGWSPCGEMLTYASATTFTVSGDLTVRYQKGTRIKFTQTTVKYFAVVASSHAAGTTTVTVTAGDDYTISNAAITSPFYSYAASPQGYPNFFNWTPSYGGFTGAVTTDYAKIAFLGNLATVFVSFSGTSNATTLTLTAPVYPTQSQIGHARGTDSGTVQTAPSKINFNTSAPWSADKTLVGGSAWTNSGTKALVANGVSFYF